MDDPLKLLDLAEEEYWEWCFKNIEELVPFGVDVLYKTEYCLSLADLAFRLRDEVDKYYQRELEKQGESHPLYKAMNQVWGVLQFKITYGFEAFWLYQAQPIHWIVAALKAKELAKENQ